MYEPNFYQRVKNIGYKVVLPAVASFGIGFLAHYFSDRYNTRTNLSRTTQEDQRTEERDRTIENVVLESDGVIICTEEDIFGKRKPKEKQE